jgi:hypothetical protein
MRKQKLNIRHRVRRRRRGRGRGRGFTVGERLNIIGYKRWIHRWIHLICCECIIYI